MQEAAAYSGGEQCLDIANSESAAREMEDVLSRRLPSFYRSAYRFLGNAADAEDAVQDALLSALQALGPVQGAVADVDMANRHCKQLCADAITEAAKPDSRLARRADWGRAGT